MDIPTSGSDILKAAERQRFSELGRDPRPRARQVERFAGRTAPTNSLACFISLKGELSCQETLG